MRLLILVLALSFGAHGADLTKMDRFIDALMAKMTVDDKVGQMTQYTAEMSVTGSRIKENYRDEIIKGRVGSVLNAYTPKFTRELQEIATKESRLKIPLLFAFDDVHGHSTIFPIPLGESTSWDLERMQNTARITATEASADGVHWTFAPMVDIARDARWGRISEGAGEDPWLGSQIARVKVLGFQGSGLGALDTVAACAKHFAAYGAVTGGRDYNSVQLGNRELFENYFPPFQAAIDAGVATMMPAFNDIGGIPSTGNEWMLRTVLRGRFKFKGLLVSDYTAIPEMVFHGVASDDEEASILAAKAGVDMDMQGQAYVRYLPKALKEKKISIHVINEAVRRILELKYKLGLFDDPFRYSDDKRAAKVLDSPANRAAARDMSRRSIVLLKNDNSILPLKRSGTIALIGPFAEDHRNMVGNWAAAGDWHKAISIREGLNNVAGDKVRVLYARGANIVDNGPLLEMLNKNFAGIENDPRPNAELIEEAVKTAKAADVVVLALGEAQNMSGEAASRTRVQIPEQQQALLRALQERARKPIVLLVSNGRPMVLQEETHLANAILETWFLGSESGNAIADVLFGDYNPSARLTTSFPVNEGQIPIFYGALPTGRPYSSTNWYSSRYLDAPNEPLFPFGFGLSYTRFSYSGLQISGDKMRPDQKLQVKVKVTNSGNMDGEETIQMYLRQMSASVSRPLKMLRGFKKVFLHKGESATVTLEITGNDLRFYNRELNQVTEPSLIKVFVGANSRDVQETSFNLLR